MKALVVGSAPHGLGEEIAHYLAETEDEVRLPTITALNVLNRDSTHGYLINEGPFDYIVYAAGVNSLDWVKDLAVESFDKHMHVNVWGFVEIAKAHMYYYPNSNIRMVVIVSDAAETPMRASLAYCASKAAALMAMRCLARECWPLLRIAAVSPGVVDGTPMTDSVDRQIQIVRGWTGQEAAAKERATKTIPDRVQKGEVVKAVAFALFGPDHLHGTNLTINGGR